MHGELRELRELRELCGERGALPAALLHSQGVHVKRVSEMLGHSTITLTLDTFSHLIPAMHGDAAAAMDAILSA